MIGSGNRAAAPPALTGLSSQIPQPPPSMPPTASPPPPPASPPGSSSSGASASSRSFWISELGNLERQGLVRFGFGGTRGGGEKSFREQRRPRGEVWIHDNSRLTDRITKPEWFYGILQINMKILQLLIGSKLIKQYIKLIF